VTTEADRLGDAERFADAYDASPREHAAGKPLASEQHGAANEGQAHITVSFRVYRVTQQMPVLPVGFI